MNTLSGRPKPRKTDLILLVDRCLAPEVAYEVSKMDGLYGIALRDHYGDQDAQHLADVTFLAEAGQQGWGVLTQNPRMWKVPHERDCITDSRTRVFSLDDPNANKTLKGLVLGRHLSNRARRLRLHLPTNWPRQQPWDAMFDATVLAPS